MKNNNYPFVNALLILVLTLISVCFVTPAQSQDDAYWVGLPLKNPAAIGSPTDWVYGGYFFTNSVSDLNGFTAGADYTISPKIGSVGFNFEKEEFSIIDLSLWQLSYAYTVSLKEKGRLSVGFGTGILNYKYNLDEYMLEPGSPSGLEPEKWVYLKSGLGLFFNAARLDLGMSYARYDELKKEVNHPSYPSWAGPDDVYTLLGAYRFPVSEKLRIEPNLLVDLEKGNTDTYAGVFFKYHERLWAGYSSLDFNDLHSVMLGGDINGKFRVGYHYSFSRLFDSDSLNLHEFLLSVRIR
ncbi:type IX secretion system membrane protein PorP/SprF [Gaoshiqia sp. Z1-71]|uniref:type IX secretion system membrane protein PorP/SprF n=1 Tax=Gaoshiqia hydrogeniformans TaxID=3290090 RepID=UPI003BF7C831